MKQPGVAFQDIQLYSSILTATQHPIPGPCEYINEIESLLESGLDPSISINGSSSLHLIMSSNDMILFNVFKESVSNLSNIDVKDSSGKTALILAIETNFTEAAVWLMDNGAKVTDKVKRIVKNRECEKLKLLFNVDKIHRVMNSYSCDLETSKLISDNQCFYSLVLVNYKYAIADSTNPNLFRGIKDVYLHTLSFFLPECNLDRLDEIINIFNQGLTDILSRPKRIKKEKNQQCCAAM